MAIRYISIPIVNIMNSLDKLQHWGDTHHPRWVDYLRVALGIVLIWKGIAFILNLDLLAHFLRASGISDHIGISVSITLIAQLIIILHLIGGIAIAVGLRTRLFCLLNLPILLGAVLLVHLRQNMFRPYAEFWLSLLVLTAIVFFIIEGNGTMALGPREE